MNDHQTSLEPTTSPEPAHAPDHADPLAAAASPINDVAETAAPAPEAIVAAEAQTDAHVPQVDDHVPQAAPAAPPASASHEAPDATADEASTAVPLEASVETPIEPPATAASAEPTLEAHADVPPESHEATADAALIEAVPTHTPAVADASTEAESSKGPRPPKQRSDAELAALRRRAQESWQRVVAAKESGESLEGTVIAVVKGGALVDMSGVRGFLPASQVRAPEGGTLESLIKTKLALKILDTDPGRRRAVVSNRRALEEERRNKRSELLASLKVGERREGTVVRLADFGAFVDLGGIDGLIPMSELAPERVEKVGDVLSVGEKLMVEILRVDEGGKKISLSRKNALPDSWRDHAALLRIGTVVQGTVVGFEPRFTVEIAPGIIGTIRDSDADPTEYAVGETMEVRVRNVDRRTRRITLVPSFGGESVTEQIPRATGNNGFAPLGVELQRALEKARRAAENAK